MTVLFSVKRDLDTPPYPPYPPRPFILNSKFSVFTVFFASHLFTP